MRILEQLLESFATIGIIVVALSLMLGFVKPADALKHGGTILGMGIVLMWFVVTLVQLWSNMSLRRRIGLAVLGIVVWLWRRPRRQTRVER
jgi:putative exporter of polyketide antibiotics